MPSGLPAKLWSHDASSDTRRTRGGTFLPKASRAHGLRRSSVRRGTGPDALHDHEPMKVYNHNPDGVLLRLRSVILDKSVGLPIPWMKRLLFSSAAIDLKEIGAALAKIKLQGNRLPDAALSMTGR